MSVDFNRYIEMSDLPSLFRSKANRGLHDRTVQSSISSGKLDQLKKIIFQFAKEKEPFFKMGAPVENSQTIIQDISSNVRSFLGLNDFFTQSPSHPAMGVTSGLDVILEGKELKNSVNKISKALKENDLKQAIKGGIELIKSSTSFTGGLTAIFHRGTKIASLIENAKQTHNVQFLSNTVNRLEVGLNFISGAVYGLMAVLRSIQIHESRKFLHKFGEGHKNSLNEVQQDLDLLCVELKKYIQFLEKKLSIKTYKSVLDGREIDSIEKKLEDKWSKKIPLHLNPKERETRIKQSVENEFYQVALEEAVKGLNNLIEAVEMPKQTTEKCKQVAKSIFTREELVQKGRQIKRASLLEKKEHKLTKFLSQAQVDFLKNENKEKIPLTQRLFSQETKEREEAINKAKSMVQEVQKTSKEAIAIHTILLICGIIGFAAMFIFPPLGISSTVTGVILLVICIIMMIVDIRMFCESLKNGQLEKYDKKILLASCVLCTLAIATALILTLAFSFGTSTLVLLAIGALWLSLNGYTLYRLKKNEKEKELLSPTLQVFQRVLLSKHASAEQVKTIFSRLSESDQKNIKLELWKKHAYPHGGRLVQSRHLWLDRFHDFGGEFLKENPLHEDVKEAVAASLKQFEQQLERLKEEEKVQKEKLKSSLLLFFNNF